jgi:hypothetical protein
MIRTLAKGLALALLTQAVPAAAQSTAPFIFSHELDALHESVMALANSPGNFSENLDEVARLHGAVAALRTSGDPRRFECLMDQAALLAGTGRTQGAQSIAELAALHAERQGAWTESATAWVTAIALARQSGDFEAAERSRQHAEWIATLLSLTGEESARIAGALYEAHWRTTSTEPRLD